MKQIAIALALTIVLSGCAHFESARNAINSVPVLEYMILDRFDEKALELTEEYFEGLTDLIEEKIDLYEADELQKYYGARGTVTAALESIRADLANSDPDAFSDQAETIQSGMTALQELVEIGAKRVIRERVAESLS